MSDIYKMIKGAAESGRFSIKINIKRGWGDSVFLKKELIKNGYLVDCYSVSLQLRSHISDLDTGESLYIVWE